MSRAQRAGHHAFLRRRYASYIAAIPELDATLVARAALMMRFELGLDGAVPTVEQVRERALQALRSKDCRS